MADSQHSGNPGNFAEDRAKAARAGHIGGQRSSGNFANDRGRAAEAGRKGGRAGRRARSGGAVEATGNFAENDRGQVPAVGQKDPLSSH
jgi:general stress protein YciG